MYWDITLLKSWALPSKISLRNWYAHSVIQLFHTIDAKKEKTKFFFGNIMSGTMAGATSLLIVYPIDFARTRLGADIGSKSERQFTGLWDCLK